MPRRRLKVNPRFGRGTNVAALVLALSILAFGIAVFIALNAGENTNEQTRKTLAREAAITRDSRDQFCLLAERDHRGKVRQLRETYEYLTDIPNRDKASTLNTFIVANLPRTEQDAVTDQAPTICDRPGLGLPEPDPVLPRRPRLDFTPPAPKAVKGIILDR